jgi:hypothetical protein
LRDDDLRPAGSLNAAEDLVESHKTDVYGMDSVELGFGHGVGRESNEVMADTSIPEDLHYKQREAYTEQKLAEDKYATSLMKSRQDEMKKLHDDEYNHIIRDSDSDSAAYETLSLESNLYAPILSSLTESAVEEIELAKISSQSSRKVEGESSAIKDGMEIGVSEFLGAADGL